MPRSFPLLAAVLFFGLAHHAHAQIGMIYLDTGYANEGTASPGVAVFDRVDAGLDAQFPVTRHTWLGIDGRVTFGAELLGDVVGPRLQVGLGKHDRLRPYAEYLFGRVYDVTYNPAIDIPAAQQLEHRLWNEGSFGVDVPLTRRIGLRPFEFSINHFTDRPGAGVLSATAGITYSLTSGR